MTNIFNGHDLSHRVFVDVREGYSSRAYPDLMETFGGGGGALLFESVNKKKSQQNNTKTDVIDTSCVQQCQRELLLPRIVIITTLTHP